MRVALAVVFAIAVAVPAAAGDLAGRWSLTLVNEFGGTIRIIVTFKQNGNKLTGICSGEEFGEMTAIGETTGSEVAWRCEDKGEHGDAQVAIFKGTLDPKGSEMKGDWTTVIKGTFSGARLP